MKPKESFGKTNRSFSRKQKPLLLMTAAAPKINFNRSCKDIFHISFEAFADN